MKYKTDKKIILLSLKEKYFEQMLDGTKRFEFRKQFPNESVTAVIYLSSPAKKVAGIVEFSKPIIFRINSAKNDPYISSVITVSLLQYFKGKEMGFAIPVISTYKLPDDISLDEIRKTDPKFQPPQSYCFLSTGSTIYKKLFDEESEQITFYKP